MGREVVEDRRDFVEAALEGEAISEGDSEECLEWLGLRERELEREFEGENGRVIFVA